MCSFVDVQLCLFAVFWYAVLLLCDFVAVQFCCWQVGLGGSGNGAFCVIA